MKMAWFAVVAGVIGLAGTRTNLHVRHSLKAHRERVWWFLIVLAWLPLVCWIASQFILQD